MHMPARRDCYVRGGARAGRTAPPLVGVLQDLRECVVAVHEYCDPGVGAGVSCLHVRSQAADDREARSVTTRRVDLLANLCRPI